MYDIDLGFINFYPLTISARKNTLVCMCLCGSVRMQNLGQDNSLKDELEEISSAFDQF